MVDKPSRSPAIVAKNAQYGRRATRLSLRCVMRNQLAGACAILFASACSSLGGPSSSTDTAPAPAPSTAAAAPWTVKTSYVLDLWMHGYAMAQRDTSRVPYFRRGYRE